MRILLSGPSPCGRRAGWLPLPVAYTTRSLPPSIGIWAPVVFAKVSVQSSTASLATSAEVISVLSRLRVLYSSTVSPFRAARSARSWSFHSPVSKTASGWTVLTRIPSSAHSSAAILPTCTRAAFEAE